MHIGVIEIILILTVVVSIVCFRDGRLLDRLALKPYLTVKRNQWYRMLSHGFVHGSWTHLAVNMLVFWSFGTAALVQFRYFHSVGRWSIEQTVQFLLLYLGGIVAASIYDVVKYRNNPYYTSIGASGGVAAVLFTCVFLEPLRNIYIMGVLPMPGILFAAIYLGYESYSAKKGGGRVNHHAHIFGAVYGFLFPVLTGGVAQFQLFLEGFR